MPEQHPAIGEGRVAVITGAASGIGLAAAVRLAGFGMKVVMADHEAAALASAAASVARKARAASDVVSVPTDVSKRGDIERLKARAAETFGSVSVLMNNAGRGGEGEGPFGDPTRWAAILDTNLWGVIHGVQVFGPDMAASGQPGAIINTGSKQGITCPPGETAYNLSKAGVKVVTEALAHELRGMEGCAVSAHLLIPGFTFTTLTRNGRTEKPAAAWTADEVVDFMLPSLKAGDFYILCPDNDVPRALDEKRIAWAAGDIVENRPALSRWHPDFKEAFADYLSK